MLHYRSKAYMRKASVRKTRVRQTSVRIEVFHTEIFGHGLNVLFTVLKALQTMTTVVILLLHE